MSEKTESNVDLFFKSFSGKKVSDKDVEDFGKRIRSYIQGQRWVMKPLSLSPTVCAQYGWKCVGSNMLECEACHAKLCVSESQIELFDAYTACISKTLSNLKESHKNHCPWPLAPAPDSFVQMPRMPKEEALSHFLHRAKQTLEFKDFPSIEDTTLSKLGLEETNIMSLCKKLDLNDDSCKKLGASLVTLAATGWKIENHEEHQKPFITCINCQRSMWVGTFHRLTELKEEAPEKSGEAEHEKHESEDIREPPKKRLRKEYFDPIESHRPWCPWVLPSAPDLNLSQENDNICAKKSPLGYETQIKSLLRNVLSPLDTSTETTPSKEHLRSARNLLETWTSPS